MKPQAIFRKTSKPSMAPACPPEPGQVTCSGTQISPVKK